MTDCCTDCQMVVRLCCLLVVTILWVAVLHSVWVASKAIGGNPEHTFTLSRHGWRCCQRTTRTGFPGTRGRQSGATAQRRC